MSENKIDRGQYPGRRRFVIKVMMKKISARCALVFAAVGAAGVLFVLLFPGTARAAGGGQITVELQNHYSGGRTVAGTFTDTEISGTDGGTKQEYKFQRQREGKDFSYVISNLEPSVPYWVELSFVEHEYSSSGKRKFNVYVQSVKVLGNLDIYYRSGAKDRAYQRSFAYKADADGRMTVRLRSDESGCRDNATISTLRLYRGSSTEIVEVSAAASRNNMSMPIRMANNGNQDTYEAILGRLGSRFSLNLLPQRLSGRFSTMGTGTGDLTDLVIAVDDGSNIRCLPFTDRFPVWESITQTQTMTSIKYSCSSSHTPFQTTVTLRAPFYPGDEKISGAPFVYADVTVKNAGGSPASGEVFLALPHKRDFAESSVSEFSTATENGVQYSNCYNYYDESTTNFRNKNVTESLAVPAGESTDVDFRGSDEAEFTDFTADTLWGYVSPAGYPKTYNDTKSPLFTFYPRGYSGAVWTITDLAPTTSVTKHFIIAGYTGEKILQVKNSSYHDTSFRFNYVQHFSAVQDVVNYAVTSRWAGDLMQEKSEFFDSTIFSDSYFSMDDYYESAARNLIAYSFQSFLINTWQAHSDGGRDWFSVWEGTCCRFHSTVDVAYNHAWFYYELWPDLLKQVMDEWVLYEQVSSKGTYLSHDMGWGDEATGQSYPHSMAVEENADYLLMLYKYWRVTGDADYVKDCFPEVTKLVDFIMNCDENNNGLPDVYTANTLDQSSVALQRSKDQAYLGVKCMGAYVATREMALLSGDSALAEECQERIEQINQTLEQDLWLSDHFAVCLDGDVETADREAYSIYAGNGLLYLMGSTRNPGVTTNNYNRFKTDLEESCERTLKTYGCTHSTFDAYNQWVSQNLWRDQVAMQMGVSLNSGNPAGFNPRYWDLSKYFARNLNGAFWDVLIYPGGSEPYGASADSSWGPVIHTTTTDGTGGASAYRQSLGYYPRGITSLGLVEAMGGLTIDVPGDALYYKPTAQPLKLPVLCMADWDNDDPDKRVPTIYFPGSGSSPSISNGELLPSTVEERKVLDVTGIGGAGHALSPNGDGLNDSVKINYNVPVDSKVTGAIWDGPVKVRDWAAQAQSGNSELSWDGKTGIGTVVGDGVYTARIDAEPYDDSYQVRPASDQMFVNRSVPNLSTDWYLAEGFTGRNETGGEFEEYVLIQNPNPEQAAVEVTFMLPGGETRDYSYQVAPSSRFTITVDELLPDHEVSTYVHADRPVAVERAMYFNGRRAGHASIGVNQPSGAWYLAEGYTDQGFDEYVLIQNPGDSQAELEVTFMTPAMGNLDKEYTVGPHSRFTIHVDELLPNHEVSTRVLSSEPVVVERAQYLNEMKSGTCSIAAVSTSKTWYLAEGYTDQGFEEYVLVQNPENAYNNITVTFMEKDGTNTIMSWLLPPECRFTIGVDGYLPASEVSVKVRSERPVLVERAMYWNERSDGHACIGTPTPDSGWNLAEGYTAQGFETWVLMQNPGDESAVVTATYMEPSGVNTVKRYLVPPRSRYTVGIDDFLPSTEVSTRIVSSVPIIVERAMYFNERSGGTDSVGIRGY